MRKISCLLRRMEYTKDVEHDAVNPVRMLTIAIEPEENETVQRFAERILGGGGYFGHEGEDWIEIRLIMQNPTF